MSVHCSYCFILLFLYFILWQPLRYILFCLFKLEFSSYIFFTWYSSFHSLYWTLHDNCQFRRQERKGAQKVPSVEAPETVIRLLLNTVRLKRKKGIEAIDYFYVAMKFKSPLDAHLKWMSLNMLSPEY